MKMPVSARILAGLLCVLFAVDLGLVVTLPMMFEDYLSRYVGLPPVVYWPQLQAFLAAVGILGLWIIGELILMLRTMTRNPFLPRNVWALRRIGTAGAITAAVFAAKCLFDFTILTVLCVFLFLVACLFAFTLADLFRRAVEYKQENDLTI